MKKNSKNQFVVIGMYHFVHLKDYKDMKLPSKTKSKTSSKNSSKTKSTKGKLRRRPKKTTRKSKKTLYYFYMDNCSYCKKFNPTWIKLVKELKSNVTMKKINGPSHPNLMKQYKIKQFPTIILVTGKHKSVYKGDRTMKDLKQFIN